ncbi:hypothetical protein Tco_1173465 [Tanacetum coccineum]
MAALKFTDSHNMVAFLEKPAECKGFEQIVDFLNANPIKYALTVNHTIYTSCIEQFWATAKAKTINEEEQLQALVDRKKVIITESTIKRDIQLEDADGIDYLPNAAIFEQLTLMGKHKKKDTQIPQSSVSSDPIAAEAVNEENVPTHYNDLLLSDCSSLGDYKFEKESQEIGEEKEENASKQGRKIYDIDADKDITLDSTHFDTDLDMFGVHDLDGDEMFIETREPMVNAATTTTQALAELKNTKPKAVTTAATTTTTVVTRPKAKGLVIQEQEQASTPITSSNDKGKGIMVEEPLKMKKKDQVLFDKQEAIRLQAQFDEEDMIAREKEEANAALIAQWNDIQDKVETDYELAQRLQAEEQEELTIKENSKLFQQLLEKRRMHILATLYMSFGYFIHFHLQCENFFPTVPKIEN